MVSEVMDEESELVPSHISAAGHIGCPCKTRCIDNPNNRYSQLCIATECFNVATATCMACRLQSLAMLHIDASYA